HGCFVKADALRAKGKLQDSQQLEGPATARTVRVRDGRTSVVDGPYAETKEYLGGFNLIEAADMDEAVLIASSFPWARTGAIEIRPVRDIKLVRQRVGAPACATMMISRTTAISTTRTSRSKRRSGNCCC